MADLWVRWVRLNPLFCLKFTLKVREMASLTFQISKFSQGNMPPDPPSFSRLWRSQIGTLLRYKSWICPSIDTWSWQELCVKSVIAEAHVSGAALQELHYFEGIGICAMLSSDEQPPFATKVHLQPQVPMVTGQISIQTNIDVQNHLFLFSRVHWSHCRKVHLEIVNWRFNFKKHLRKSYWISILWLTRPTWGRISGRTSWRCVKMHKIWWRTF